MSREPGATMDYQPIAEGPGSSIGPYKLLQKVGEGGFGVVYMAEQLEPVRRKVALKIIKPGMDTKEVIARFESERQALALMDHPNIARVLDAGATDSGRPFFVMELVKGVPLTEYCDKNHCTTRQRLELFATVCRAVQHAHQKGIIHRDIKPSNVMVTLHDSKPVPKVIDFGVAKATSQQLTERTLYTAYGQMIGTPSHMSPEQAEMSGLDVDTRSDIYSLGVLLYELLTGRTPLDARRLRETSYAEMQRIIREEEPPTPSTRLSTLGDELTIVAKHRGTDPQRLRREIKGDLDWIVMKALEKDRNCRYDTANAFAADVDRYLRDDPIEARPPTISYKIKKFARRHKRWFAMAAAIAAMLVIATAVSTWQAVRATHAQHDADRQRRAAVTAQQEVAAERDQARDANEKLQLAQRELQANQEQLRRTLYAAHLALIQTAWESDNVGRVIQLLDEQRLQTGATDLRGFEWHYWQRLCHADLRTMKVPNFQGQGASLSPDGTRMAASVFSPANKTADLKVWNTATGDELLKIQASSNYIRSVKFSPDGARIAMIEWDWGTMPSAMTPRTAVLRVCDASSGKEIFAVKEPGRVIRDLAFSDDGSRLAAVGYIESGGRPSEGDLRIWDLASREELVRTSAPGQFNHVAFSPDGTRLVACMTSLDEQPADVSNAQVRDAATGAELFAIQPGSGGSVYSTAFSPDGTRLAVAVQFGNLSGEIKVCDASNGHELCTIRKETSIGSVRFSPDGTRLAGFGDPTVRIWDAANGKLWLTLKGHASAVSDIVFGRDGTRIYSAAHDGTVKVWDATTSNEPPDTKEQSIVDSAIAMTRDGNRIATMNRRAFGQEERVRVLDSSGKELMTTKAPEGHAHDAAFSPDGMQLAVVWHKGGVGIEGTYELKMWDVATGNEVRSIASDSGTHLSGLAFSPDGRRIASATASTDAGRELKVWDVTTGTELRAIAPAAGATYTDVAFSPDGTIIAAAVSISENETDEKGVEVGVRLWDAASNREPRTLKAHGRNLQRVVFNADGRLVAAAIGDYREAGEVIVWNAATGEELFTLKGHAGYVSSVAFSPNGRRIATVANSLGRSQSGEVKLWCAATGQELLTLKPRAGEAGMLAFSLDGHRLITTGSFAGPGNLLQAWDATPLPESRNP